VSDLCEITSSKRIFAADYQAEGVPFFRGKEITEKYNGAIEVSTELFIARSKFEEIKAKSGAPMSGDLLLTSVGTLGSTYVVRRGDEFYFKDGNITWFRDFRGLDSNYFNYWLTAPDGRAELKKCTIGSSQSAYTIILLKGMEIELPSLPEQHRIASILSAYDDLIENNTRRITILEEMARRIHDEWFVRFRFPEHEGVRMVESELGLVPEGWSVQGLYDVADLTYGFPFKSNLFKEGGEGLGVIRIRDIRDDYTGTRTTEDVDPKYRVTDGDILVGMDGAFHMGRWAGGVAWLNQRVVRFRPKVSIPRSWLFWVTEEPIKTLEATIVGTTVAHLSARDLKEMRLLVPSRAVLEVAASVLEPMNELELTLKKKNANLRTTRDLLLPKLISGELDVSAMPEPEALAA